MSQEVLFSEIKGSDANLGVITLNRPQVLNSLNHNMVIAMYNQLKEWEHKADIKAVIIKAIEGRAFCAGGDIRSAYERGMARDAAALHFFREEYQLNRLIFHFPKPYIALLDGVTMGGGVGISIHGSHRVATENLLFAMPETGIGFFPDVGGTYFLPGLPGKIGYYLGLTGARLASDDCVAIGIAQQKVNREQLTDLVNELATQPFSQDAHESVTNIINQFGQPVATSFLLDQQAILDACFSQHSMEDIMQALQESPNLLCIDAVTMLAKKSPTSLKVTLKALNEGKLLDFDACMDQEFTLASHFLQNHDFFEGIRALIIDKDQAPNWYPALLEDVTPAMVNSYFIPQREELTE